MLPLHIQLDLQTSKSTCTGTNPKYPEYFTSTCSQIPNSTSSLTIFQKNLGIKSIHIHSLSENIHPDASGKSMTCRCSFATSFPPRRSHQEAAMETMKANASDPKDKKHAKLNSMFIVAMGKKHEKTAEKQFQSKWKALNIEKITIHSLQNSNNWA